MLGPLGSRTTTTDTDDVAGSSSSSSSLPHHAPVLSTSDLSEQIPRPANPLPPWQPRNRTRGLRRNKDKARGLRACSVGSCPHIYSRPPRPVRRESHGRHPVNSKLSVRITCPLSYRPPCLLDRSISGRDQRACIGGHGVRARLHCRDDPVQRRSGFWIRNGFHSPLATKLAWAGRHLAECMDHAWMRLQAALLVEVAFGFVATYSSN